MLRRFAYNKIFRATGMLLLLFLLVLFPVNKEYSLDDTKKPTKEVINNDDMQSIYLLDRYNYIALCNIKLSYTDSFDYARKVLETLVLDGKYIDKIPNGFKGILPSSTIINNINIDGNKIYVDLSGDIYELDEEKRFKAYQLITYNLTIMNNISEVYIKVNGNILEESPFKREDGINKDSNLTNYKNVYKTTIYYIGENSTNKYYVPVTKLNNENKEKIEIIIDELKSNSTYDTNLMSFLNYNTKLLDYNINNDVMTLNFNEYIFDDIKTSNILEEVIYTISLSIFDNYDVKEVVFNVNNKEITKSTIKNIVN